MTNGTRPYKSAYRHDMSCPYVINHALLPNGHDMSCPYVTNHALLPNGHDMSCPYVINHALPCATA